MLIRIGRERHWPEPPQAHSEAPWCGNVWPPLDSDFSRGLNLTAAPPTDAIVAVLSAGGANRSAQEASCHTTDETTVRRVRCPPATNLRALTLIEILVVITIIGILIALLLSIPPPPPVVCQNNLRQIGMAIRMYADENCEYAPFLGELPNADPRYMQRTPEQMLGTYIGNEWRVFRCPQDREPRRFDWYVWRSDSGDGKPWPDWPEEISYMWSEQLLRGFYPDYPSTVNPDERCSPPWKAVRFDLNRISEPRKWGVLSEGSHMLNAWKWRVLDPDYFDTRIDQIHWGRGRKAQVNMLFASGNVELIKCRAAHLRKVRSSPVGDDPY